MSQVDIQLFNRTTQKIESELVYEQWFMDFFYGTRIGMWLADKVLKRPFLSALVGARKHTPKSKESIQSFIQEYGIDINEVADPIESFETFNAFFIRTLKEGARPIPQGAEALISPADGRLIHFPINQDTVIPVKGSAFTIQGLLADASLASRFRDGDCIIVRLAPADYHRFIYLDAGKQSGHRHIHGSLHSVSPYAIWQGLKVFTENRRELCLLETENFGAVAQVDVGAMLVGKMVQSQEHGGTFTRGDEKGYFEFGGSTIVLLFESGKIQLDPDIREYSSQGIETLVKCGSQIGTKPE